MKMILSIYSFEDGKMLKTIACEKLTDKQTAEYDIFDFEKLYNKDEDLKYDLSYLIEDCYPGPLVFTNFFILKDMKGEEEILGVWRPNIGFSYFGPADYDDLVRIKNFMPHLDL